MLKGHLDFHAKRISLPNPKIRGLACPFMSFFQKINGVVTYKKSRNKLSAGLEIPVRVNASIGLDDVTRSGLKKEEDKISGLIKHEYSPDIFMDLSIVQSVPEPWEIILQNFEGPVGCLPHYTIFSHDKGLDVNLLLDRISEMIEKGISFITIHPTPNLELLKLATQKRMVPITSRGGGVVVRDMLINRREKSIYAEIFEEICKLAADSGVVINLGTSFRSSNVSEGMDDVTYKELSLQGGFIDKAHSLGAQVVLEGPGHLCLSQIDEYVNATHSWSIPLMPLGPIVSDAFPGNDHFTNAIGAAHMMIKSRGGIINAVSRNEHKGGIPTLGQLKEALDAATVAAHSATITYDNNEKALDKKVANARSQTRSCVIPPITGHSMSNGGSGCDRCGPLCPLTFLKISKKHASNNYS
jgi:phosphomethylpyrimidine synthase